MAKMELRKPINSLLEEKSKLDQQLTTIMDEYNVTTEKLASTRADLFSYRESKEHLSQTNLNKAARLVFDKNIAECQKQLQDISGILEKIEQRRVIVHGKIKAMEKSIKELQNV